MGYRVARFYLSNGAVSNEHQPVRQDGYCAYVRMEVLEEGATPHDGLEGIEPQFGEEFLAVALIGD